MTPVEKAKQIHSTHYYAIAADCSYSFEIAKECALISVDEIMKAPFENSYLELVPDDAPDSDWYWDKFREYWEQVKHEINNI